jgi:hypothetical protein
MNNRPGKRVWVAVRIQRGFVSDIRAFEEKEFAFRQERRWRRGMNPDYDETGIARVKIITAKASPPRQRRTSRLAGPHRG